HVRVDRDEPADFPYGQEEVNVTTDKPIAAVLSAQTAPLESVLNLGPEVVIVDYEKPETILTEVAEGRNLRISYILFSLAPAHSTGMSRREVGPANSVKFKIYLNFRAKFMGACRY